MVEDTGAKVRPSASRPLNQPRPVKVIEGHEGWPQQVYFSGAMSAVASIEDRWRIDDEWWREKPISRMYFDCVLEEGQRVAVFQDLMEGKWYRQQG